ncbi:hypothetical protein GOV12_02160 [Candidatus Pacearchaeota archaeon]|nr:hypothetical protein [Candidatus Pacearchaeota archaeon]
MVKKRERLEVIKDVLDSVREGRKIKPTRLLYASNLSPQMFKEYIDELLKKDFIRLESDEKGKKTFSLNQKGYEFLQEYKIIQTFVENFGL